MGCKQGVKPVRNWREADDGHDNAKPTRCVDPLWQGKAESSFFYLLSLEKVIKKTYSRSEIFAFVDTVASVGKNDAPWLF